MRPSTDDALAAWDRWSQTNDMRSSTSDTYRNAAKRFLLWLEPQPLELRDVTVEDIERFLGSFGSSTCKTYRSAFHYFFDALIAAGIVPTNPIPKKHYVGYRRRPKVIAAKTSLESDSMIEEFPSLSEIEKQATVDAAAFALVQHDVHLFTNGEGGASADVDRCERVLRLGEQHGITPYSWADWNSPEPETLSDSSDECTAQTSVVNEDTRES
jgi:hypothetical protein